MVSCGKHRGNTWESRSLRAVAFSFSRASRAVFSSLSIFCAENRLHSEYECQVCNTGRYLPARLSEEACLAYKNWEPPKLAPMKAIA